MNNIHYIKSEIKRLYETDPNVHVSLTLTRPKVIVKASPAKIVGIYKNIFQIEECVSAKTPIRHTFQYDEVLIGQLVIAELDYVPTINLLNVKKK